MSKVTVEPKALNAALSRATGAIMRVRTIPILGCVRLSIDGEELLIEATDLDRFVTVRIAAEGELSPLCIDYARLSGILSAVKDRSELSIEPTKEGAVIAAGRSRFTVATMPTDHWPTLEEPKWQHAFELAAPPFARLMTALEPAISTEETRFYLNGIFLQPGSLGDPRQTDMLLAVATDGHKLGARHMAAPGLPAIELIVPRVACAAIAKLFGDADTLQVSCNDRKLMVTVGSTSYITKLIEGTFPDWRRITPVSKPSAFSYDLSAIMAAGQVAAASKSAEKLGKAIKLTFGSGETQIQATDFNNPAFTGADVVPHSDLGEPEETEIGVNVEYLLEMLPTLDAETIELTPSEKGGPIILRGATHQDRLALIMPQRI